LLIAETKMEDMNATAKKDSMAMGFLAQVSLIMDHINMLWKEIFRFKFHHTCI